jgi:large subunit ribosomal protein L21
VRLSGEDEEGFIQRSMKRIKFRLQPTESGGDMQAVIETGGKQYRVSPGDTIQVETLAGEPGQEVEFDRVVAVFGDANELIAGEAVKQARVKGTIAGHGRGEKVLVFKFKRKKQYKRTIGHRQNYTSVTVGEILV